MAGFQITLDHAGIAEVLKSAAMAAAVHAAAETVAANARGIRVEEIPGEIQLPVEVTDHITDRARSSVTLAHPAGQAVQAKYGVLTKGAAAAGGSVSG